MMNHKSLLIDLQACISFFTRIPLPQAAMPKNFAQSLWAAPIAGIPVALIGGIMFVLTASLDLPPLACGLIAIAATILATGALHEDGFADIADSFGGRDMEHRLGIMHDSRIGTYGAIALIITVLLRASALAAFVDQPGLGVLVLVAAFVAARALMPAFMCKAPLSPHAGLVAKIGRVPDQTAYAALGTGVLGLVLLLGIGTAFICIALLMLWSAFIHWLCIRQIQGINGDFLGMLGQGAEILVLLCASALLL
ncbi:adenosylcobinamide-GDP ribazoletransferase [Limoniibacter endophyticus]|uniref:Adenosylcobinamide-GDP ribazoletransferase n=1 Tax=Limoniibacter endophyticus TaxID=1565040 RepID=A0A8J3DQZ4_9HYPH|nr:adenosylcobinamide-GDP ribazoletransferase [Limoniibacter endophyticus]GHC78488.1 adenosylcobinamide-GDP ribazoletransferase [Limoniibacter endophyticus]